MFSRGRQRVKIIDHLEAHARLHPRTLNVADDIDYPPETVARGLEDLTAHGVVTRESTHDGRQPMWSLSDWAWKRLREIELAT
jgi:hypothetical protein